tara:strand:+ start:980 stop:1639 length:660 start_codon:yes stop_codon:yes gene_type:complete
MSIKVHRGDGWSLSIKNLDVIKALASAPERVTQKFRFALRDIVAEISSTVITGMSDYSPGKKSPNAPLQVRTGKLQQTIQGYIRGTSFESLEGVVSAGNATVPYAHIQEYGGTITPKSSEYLRIPLPEILTDRGDVQGNYEIYNRGGRYETGSGEETYLAGSAIMVNIAGKPTPIYALVKSVKIPPRLGIRKTGADKLDYIETRFEQAIELALKPQGGA